MKIFDILTENLNFLNDQKTLKMVYITLMHDDTVPLAVHRKIGTKFEPEEVKRYWESFLDSLNKYDATVIDQDRKFFQWVTKLYVSGGAEYEDIVSRLPENVFFHQGLARRNLIPDEFKDLNKFGTLAKLEQFIRRYANDIRKIKDEAKINKLKATAKSFNLLDDEQYLVSIPLNTGGACVLGRSVGSFANWCTATFGNNYFDHYYRSGPMIVIVSKDDPDQKYQFHAATRQFMDKEDRQYSASEFAQKHPNIMQRTVDALRNNQAEIQHEMDQHSPSAHDVEAEATKIERVFSDYFGKPEPAEEPTEEPVQ